MKIKLLALSLAIVVLPSFGAASAAPKQSRVIYLVSKDGGSKIATIHVNEDSMLCEFNGNSEAALFTGEALFTINNQDKTYRVQSYSDLEAAARNKARELAQQTKTVDTSQGVILELTDEVNTISGVKARKLKKIVDNRSTADFWVSSELSPAPLRTFGERVRTALPRDYWLRVHGNPGMIEIIALYGVPLSFSDGATVYEAQIKNADSDAWSKVPEGYKKVQ
jgi:hypothetical protein